MDRGKLTSNCDGAAADLICTVLYCTVLYCTVLYCTVLYCTVLYCPPPHNPPVPLQRAAGRAPLAPPGRRGLTVPAHTHPQSTLASNCCPHRHPHGVDALAGGVAGLPADVSRLLHHHPGRAHGAGRRVVPRTWGRRGVARSNRY